MAASASQGKDSLVEVAVRETDMSTNEGCAVIRLSLATPTDIAAIAFRNQYSASFTLRCKSNSNSNSAQTDEWIVAVRDETLMPNPHCEDKGQDVFTFVETMFVNPAASKSVSELQLLLKQPSPHWIKFGLADFKCFAPPHGEQLPSCVPIADEVGRLLSIAGLISDTAKETNMFDRFDVNGAYEIQELVLD